MHSALKYLGEKDIIYVIYPQMVQKTYCVCICVERKSTKELNISSWWIWVKGIQVSFGLFLQLYKVEREKTALPETWQLSVKEDEVALVSSWPAAVTSPGAHRAAPPGRDQPISLAGGCLPAAYSPKTAFFSFWEGTDLQSLLKCRLPNVFFSPALSFFKVMAWWNLWQPTLVSLAGESYGQRSLTGYSPWGRKRVRHHRATNTRGEICGPHRARPREVHTARQALPHLVAEEADTDALEVLGGDLQRTEEGWLVSVALAGVGTDAPQALHGCRGEILL